MQWEPLPPQLEPLPNFACYLLRELNLADTPTKQQLGILDYLENGPDRKIVTAYRGCGKSFLTSVFALWRLRRDPFREKILLVGATADKAIEISTFMLRLVRDVDVLQCLQPLPDGRGSVNAWDVGPAVVDQSPSCRAVGILSPSLTGKRSTCVIGDDIETMSNSITVLKQERLAAAVTELEAIRKPHVDGELPRQTIFLGTPHLESSLYLRMRRERNYQARMWPARFPDPASEDWDSYEDCLAPAIAAEVEMDPSLVGEPTDPERFGHDELLKRELSMTRASVQLQYQLNCRLSTLERYPIRLGDLVVTDLDGKALPEVISWASGPDQRIQELVCIGMGADRYYHRPLLMQGWVSANETWRCCMSIDPAGRGGGDELAWAVVAEYAGNLFVLESGGTQQGYSEEVLKTLALRAKRWNCSQIVAESNFGAGMFEALLAPVMNKIHPCSIESVRVSQQKERRIVDQLAPLVQQHRLVFNADLIRKDYREAEQNSDNGHARSLMFQLSRITTERGALGGGDDRIDALALACQFFTEAAAQDQQRVQANRDFELWSNSIEMWKDETGASIDALALGLTQKSIGRHYGGVRRGVSSRRL